MVNRKVKEGMKVEVLTNKVERGVEKNDEIRIIFLSQISRYSSRGYS